MGATGLKPWIQDPLSPRAHPSAGSGRGVYNEPATLGELGIPCTLAGERGWAGVERSACVCMFLGILGGWWVTPCVSTNVGSTASPLHGEKRAGDRRGAMPMGSAQGGLPALGLSLRDGC